MLLLPVKLVKKNRGRNLFTDQFVEGGGDPIAKKTAEIMRLLHNARMRALAGRVDVGMDPDREPVHLFFELTKLLDLLEAVKTHPEYNHLAVCPALTLLDPVTNLPIAPDERQIALMEEALNAESSGNMERFAEILKLLKLVQTVILAGCTRTGDIIIDEPAPDGSGGAGTTGPADISAFKYYDFAGQCCNTKKGKEKDKCITETYLIIK